MNKIDDWLKEVLQNPVFADVKPQQHRATSSDRLVKSFQEVLDFVDKNGRLPKEDGPFEEKKLYTRLDGIKKDKAKYDKCKPYDTSNILEEYQEQTQEDILASILNNPAFNLSPEAASLFDMPQYMKEAEERAQAEYIGKHTPCEDFDKFKPLFDAVHKGIDEGTHKLIKFKEAHLEEGTFFVIGGVVAYLAKIHDIQKNKNYRNDGRIRCIYDNGTESDILLRSLAKSLYLDGYTVQNTLFNADEHLKKNFTITDLDVASGFIYVLKSKSEDPAISSIKDLYKIGFTTQTVEERIANAKNDATYLYADVDIVASWEVYNIKAVAFENALHKLFKKTQLKLAAGAAHPKEWYIVPYKIIEEAVSRLIQGEKIGYDTHLQKLVSEE
ncbi:MAG: GIY-YIG nuclease family protein [Alphaproteobacteria bacterium]|nr:GIY-YIG nuclease family protein [Alphaproteobacteria bacterium]MBQ6987526.1 GIY-YIG nuclease family protein [Alistipes sp.]